MVERSLRITGTNTTFFNKITKTLTKILIPTKICINGMLISIKRNSLIKAYENFKKDTENYDKEELEKKYDEAYTVYLEALDKYNKFYVDKMDALYKVILKNYSIKLADTTNIYDSSKEWIYVKIFYTLEEYIKNILPLKMEINPKDEFKDIIDDYERFESYTVGKLDTKDNIEKNMILLGISRKLFTHSIPLIVAEQCYEKLLKDARVLVQDTKMAAKREKAYAMLINLIEDYNIRLLSTKVYWNDMKERDNYRKYWDKYKEISKLKDVDFVEYMRQKEILFIKNDMKKLKNSKVDYSKIITYYRRKLIDYGAIRELKNDCKSIGKYTGTINKEDRVVA